MLRYINEWFFSIKSSLGSKMCKDQVCFGWSFWFNPDWLTKLPRCNLEDLMENLQIRVILSSWHEKLAIFKRSYAFFIRLYKHNILRLTLKIMNVWPTLENLKSENLCVSTVCSDSIIPCATIWLRQMVVHKTHTKLWNTQRNKKGLNRKHH